MRSDTVVNASVSFQAEVIKKAGDAYNRTRLTLTVKWLFEKWLSWSR
jgi:hypothetical protein